MSLWSGWHSGIGSTHFRACTPTVRWHFQSMKKSKMQKHATPSGQKRAGTQRSVARTPADFAEEMVQAYALNDRMNQLVLEHLDPRAWRAKPSGKGTRTIAAIFTHVHNVRCKWLRLSAPHLKITARLDRTRSTQKQAASALAESAARCCEMMSDALSGSAERVPSFLRGASPRTSLYAEPSTRISSRHPNHRRDVELGKTGQGPRPS